jgi:hypothetical protein
MFPSHFTIKSLQLSPITVLPIDLGGFRIHYGTVPPNARVFLCVGNKDNRIEITGQYGVWPRNQLMQLLTALEQLGLWAQKIPVWVVAEQSGLRVGESDQQMLAAPVQPFDGPLTLASMGAQTPRLTYCGNGVGRLLTDGKLTDKYYFREGLHNGGILETDPRMRGFDCTTFIMSLFQKFPNMSGKYGTYLVESLGATPCSLEQVKARDAPHIFQFPLAKMGFYVMWSETHMVLVKDAMLYQCRGNGSAKGTASWAADGYPQPVPAGSWPGYHYATLWWIRQLPPCYSA